MNDKQLADALVQAVEARQVMGDWKQEVEAQIARERYTGKVELTLDQANALLDVAVAVEQIATHETVHLAYVQVEEIKTIAQAALDKLREMGDE